jgi:hypothetical protein
MTNKKYETKAILAKTVLYTWSGTLQNELSLPENWINCSGVLVGIRPSEQPWWHQAEPVEYSDIWCERLVAVMWLCRFSYTCLVFTDSLRVCANPLVPW